MATRAQEFKYRTQRSGKPRAKLPARPRRDVPVDTSKPGISATARRAGGGSTAARNRKKKTVRATYALEDSAQRNPSRKSTRKSSGRIKAASNLARRETRRTASPKRRQRKAHAKRTRVRGKG